MNIHNIKKAKKLQKQIKNIDKYIVILMDYDVKSFRVKLKVKPHNAYKLNWRKIRSKRLMKKTKMLELNSTFRTIILNQLSSDKKNTSRKN